jgi:hypothetical protein
MTSSDKRGNSVSRRKSSGQRQRSHRIPSVPAVLRPAAQALVGAPRALKTLRSVTTILLALVLTISITAPARVRGSDPVLPVTPAQRASPNLVPAMFAANKPAANRDLYDELDRILTDAEKQLPDDAGAFCPIFSTNLTAANANRGPMILEARVRKNVVANLDAFKAVPLTAVAVSIPYPVLADDFPRSREYRDFYRWVAEQARARGFALFIESGTAFRAPLGGMPVAEYYRGLTPQRYMRQKRQMIEWILRVLQPQYLTLENEPDTQTMNTGMEFTPARVVQFVNHYLKDLNRGKTKIGAGAGTWLPPVYLERLAAETPIDYLDIHIYPVNRNFFIPRALEAAKIASRHKKSLVIGEAWLYKMRDSETGRKAAELETFARDAYSFWAPLDGRFIQILARLARAKHIDLVSFFWPQFLFGYAEYTPTLDTRTPREISEAAIRAAVPNILKKGYP